MARWKHSRTVAALAAGAVVYLAVLYRFLTYTERNRLSAISYLVFAGLLLVTGFGLTLGMNGARYRIAAWMIAGVWTGHMLVVIWDTHLDPTDHNLLPFEFIILGIVASPAYLGVALAQVAGWLKKR